MCSDSVASFVFGKCSDEEHPVLARAGYGVFLRLWTFTAYGEMRLDFGEVEVAPVDELEIRAGAAVVGDVFAVVEDQEALRVTGERD